MLNDMLGGVRAPRETLNWGRAVLHRLREQDAHLCPKAPKEAA